MSLSFDRLTRTIFRLRQNVVGQFRSADGLVLLGGGSLRPQQTCRPSGASKCTDCVTLMWRLPQKSSFDTLDSRAAFLRTIEFIPCVEQNWQNEGEPPLSFDICHNDPVSLKYRRRG